MKNDHIYRMSNSSEKKIRIMSIVFDVALSEHIVAVHNCSSFIVGDASSFDDEQENMANTFDDASDEVYIQQAQVS
jgi:hypothetical protein